MEVELLMVRGRGGSVGGTASITWEGDSGGDTAILIPVDGGCGA